MPAVTDLPIVAPARSRWRIALGAAVVLVLVALGAAVVSTMLSPNGPAIEIIGGGGGGSAATARPPVLVVHVLGAVAAPGLYELPEGSRVVDAVAAAGGFSGDADRGGVNLARLLLDAEQIVVPVAGAVAADTPGEGLVNLNTADSVQLQVLPRVGPALAERIIAWREANGGFRSIDDLLAVSGIGAATFEGLRPLVTV